MRFDVYSEDDDRAFDIEIQTTDKRNWELRTRFYHSKMDNNLINQGEDYLDLKETYVIFLCTFDPIGLKDCKYETVHVLKNHMDYLIDDKRHIILYNIREYLKSEDKELSAFFEYMTNGEVKSEFSREVQQDVDKSKLNENLRSNMMTLEMEINIAKKDARNEGIAVGEARGSLKTRLETARKMKLENLPLDLILRITGLTPEQIQEL